MAIVAITSTSFLKNDALRRYASERFAGHDLRFGDPTTPPSLASLAVFLADVDAVIIGRETIDTTLLARLPKLRAVAMYGVGYDNVDTNALAHRGIPLLVRRGVNRVATAEHTIGLMLNVLRRITTTNALLHQGIWDKNGGVQLSGRTVGIVGCGNVGAELARLLAAFGCRLLLTDIEDKAGLAAATGGEQVPFKETLQKADILTMHVPLTRATRGMVGAAELSAMRPTAVVVNTSRGGVVDEAALAAAVKDGTIAGAALDVFSEEPLIRSPLMGLPNVVLTPHTAGNAVEAVQAMGQAAVDDLAAFLKERGNQ